MLTDAYKNIALFYDFLFERGLRRAWLLGIGMWSPKKGMRVLDIGCGTGSQLLMYLNHGCTVSGVDQSPSMIGVARKKTGNAARLDVLEMDTLPYPYGSFDLVLLSMLMHEVSEAMQIKLLAEARRVMTNAGKILVLDYHPKSTQSFRGWLERLITILIERMAGPENYNNYKKYIECGGMPALIKHHRLKIEKELVFDGGNLGLFLLANE